MANDATSKTTSNSDCIENTSLSNPGDQQKVPPLRIVLNSAGNQKSSTASTTCNPPSSAKREKTQDNRQEGQLKTGGRVRIKLGTNKQDGKGGTNYESNDTSNKSENLKSRDKSTEKTIENINEDSSSSFSHLRRITRRSQRTVQSISNEDEESISSMTSVDENLNAANSTQLIGDTANEVDQSNPATTTSSTTLNSATNGSSNADTPRRYKRKKVETCESQSFDCDSLLAAQNYKLPNQNSFELFKNIRRQVDKKLKSLTCIQPKTPFGFRDYMLSRGAYLLDGNKLGNGTNLFMNEHGGFNPAPPGKYHLIRQNRINYSVPNRGRAPLDLPLNSPLHNLFIEQEKERYRMQIQHIKEREKLTLAAEQEFMRVYNQAALAASNQTEPFSVCTMLKHQEMYNYLDSDGTTILSREDAQQDQVSQPDGVRTRRRQHGQISPTPARKGSNVEESVASSDNAEKKTDTLDVQDQKRSNASTLKTKHPEQQKELNKHDDSKQNTGHDPEIETTVKDPMEKEESASDESKSVENPEPSKTDQANDSKVADDIATKKNGSETNETDMTSMDCGSSQTRAEISVERIAANESSLSEQDETIQQRVGDVSKEPIRETNNEQKPEAPSTDEPKGDGTVTDEEKKVINKEKFLAHLQEIDDKWDKIRHEMLIRHKNEAESLHAIQKLEWEWKTKEIGACDVRTTLYIDNSLVPKLDIFSQDY